MEMVRGIAAAAEQQAGVSDEISKNVEEISAVTRQSSQGAGQASQAAADLSRQADRLQGLVGRFKI
jgi:methyl-accepting chemotaxis protein